MFSELNGKTIERVERLSQEDCDVMRWYKKPVVIVFTDGSYMIPMADDESNEGGSMLYHDETKDKTTLIYTD